VRFDDIRRHYFCTHRDVNPNRIVALRPDEDLNAPHDRAGVRTATAA
jgi:putative glutathione S-transferase